MKERRAALGGYCPERRSPESNLTPPGEEGYAAFDEGTKGEMQVSTTMAFVRLLRGLMKDAGIGERIVPIENIWNGSIVCRVWNLPSRWPAIHSSRSQDDYEVQGE